MSGLIRYDAACQALADCKAIDEVKDWHDKAAAMQAYGRIAKNKNLEIDAAEIRIRAERRLGEIITQQKDVGGLNAGGRPSKETPREKREVSAPPLKDAGISHDLSSRAQKMAAVPEDEFEKEVGEWREKVSEENARVTTRLQKAGEREIAKVTPSEDHPDAPPEYTELDQLRDSLETMVDEVDRLTNLLAANIVAVGDEERESLAARMDSLTAENKKLRTEVRIITDSRDAWQNQVAELKSQISRQNKEITKLTGKKR